MKKTLVILLMFIYGITSVGATVQLHYCMNEYVGWELSHGKENNTCGKCGMKDKETGCCKDEQKQLKISVDQKNQTSNDIVAPLSFAVVESQTTSTALPFYFIETVVVPIVQELSPPIQAPPLFISYCSFLI